jgi:proteasome lid subunit RPN8/RPN11
LERSVLDSINIPNDLGLILTRQQYRTIIYDVQSHANEEACGLIAGQLPNAKKIYPITNELHSATRFRMAGSEQIYALMDIEDKGWDLIAIYHSHLYGPGEPSETDKNEYAFPGVYYLIIDLSSTVIQLRGFDLIYGNWIEVPIRIKNM